MNRNDPRLLAGIVIVCALIGYLTIVRPAQATIAARYGDIEGARAILERDLNAAHQLPAREREERALAHRLAALHLHDPRAAVVDRFLHATQTVAERHAVRIQTVAAETVTPVRGAPPVFDELPLDVTIRGSYAATLRAMRELNDRAGAAQITVTAIGNAQRAASADPQLTATLHITLLREADAQPSPAHSL